MAESTERKFDDVTVRIDRLVCVGFEDCAARAPEVFRLGADGIACFVDWSEPIDRERLIEACRACPVSALAAFDPGGEQLAP